MFDEPLQASPAPTGLFTDETEVARCVWCRATPFYQHYHDHEWGLPVGSDTRLFEKICLEGFQAGLSWLTILNKREGFRAAFAGFDMDKIAVFDDIFGHRVRAGSAHYADCAIPNASAHQQCQRRNEQHFLGLPR